MRSCFEFIVATLIIVPSSAVRSAENLSVLSAQVVESYVSLVHSSYTDAWVSAQHLNRKLSAFVRDPSEASLQDSKDAWITAHSVYGLTEAFRFYGGPIDDSDSLEGLINAWPLDEAYLDYVAGDQEAGLINQLDRFPEITEELLVSLNEKGGEKFISSGYHAIEFLLWGQDLSATSAGTRPVSDYTTERNAERRGHTLQLLGQLLVKHLAQVTAEWAPGQKDNYRNRLLSLPAKVGLQKILTGIAVLSGDELPHERLYVAYETRDQEDEQSCFSDTTHKDLLANQAGIKAVYDGNVPEVGLHALVNTIDPELSKRIHRHMMETSRAIQAIPIPFDRALRDELPQGRSKILAAVEALEMQAELIVEITKTLDIRININ